MGFVRKHVAEHLRANRPGTSPSVSQKHFHAALTTAQRCCEHRHAAVCALSQCRSGLPWRAVRTVELRRNSQVRSREPDPLAADIMHVREDGRNGADLPGRFGRRFYFPDGGVKMLDKNLVHALISGKDPDCAPSEFRVDLAFLRGHRFVLPDQSNVDLSCIYAVLATEPYSGPGRRIDAQPEVYCVGGCVAGTAGGAFVSVCFVNRNEQGRPRIPAPSSRLPAPDVSVNFAST